MQTEILLHLLEIQGLLHRQADVVEEIRREGGEHQVVDVGL